MLGGAKLLEHRCVVEQSPTFHKLPTMYHLYSVEVLSLLPLYMRTLVLTPWCPVMACWGRVESGEEHAAHICL